MFGTDLMPYSRVKLGIIIIIISIIIFTSISIMTNNWLFLLSSIPPNLMTVFTIFMPKRKNFE